ncbi:MAG: hypothetical protein NCA08_11110 [Deltaproteobacteria bacterium]|nr:hypothetical protein [Candidatus Deferrimicrobium borealis]
MRWAKPQRRALKAFLRDGSSEHWKVILGTRRKRKGDEALLEEYRALLESRRRERDIFADREPLVSVRIATYNRARILVERTIPSVLSQTYRNFEIMIVGDHCTEIRRSASARTKVPSHP